METVQAHCTFINMNISGEFPSDSIDIGEGADVHMMTIQRANGIFGAHPFVEEVFQCKNQHEYCTVNGVKR